MSSLDESSQDPADPTNLHIFTEQQQHVLRLLRGLPPGQRTIAALFYDGMACGEIADVLNRTSATVRSQLRNARETLKEMMASGDI
jgi:RNA polymerase sigma factor (sigma-70 family)